METPYEKNRVEELLEEAANLFQDVDSKPPDQARRDIQKARLNTVKAKSLLPTEAATPDEQEFFDQCRRNFEMSIADCDKLLSDLAEGGARP